MQDPSSVSRIRRGDGGTLKRLFKANHPRLYAVAYRLTQDADAADQVVRGAFLRLWKKRDELEPLDVLFLRLVDYTHELALEYRVEHNVTGLECESSGGDGEMIVQQINGLPEEERLTYLLHIADGYTIRELSRAFRKSENDIREIVGRALVGLDTEFEADVAGRSGSSDSGGSLA
jgi:DNA-directed RNA polymerase specialized sigma24 family protein